MSKSYFLVYKTKNILNSNISKILIFKTAELAYEYAINNDYHLKKEILNTVDDAIKQKIIWKTSAGFPTRICKIIEIDSDLLCNIYQLPTKDTNIVHFLYKQLKLLSIA